MGQICLEALYPAHQDIGILPQVIILLLQCLGRVLAHPQSGFQKDDISPPRSPVSRCRGPANECVLDVVDA